MNKTINMINEYFNLLACCIGSSNLNAANKYAALAAPRIHNEMGLITVIMSFLFITPKGRSIMGELYKELFKTALELITMIPGVKMGMAALWKMALGYLRWERNANIKMGSYMKYKQLYHEHICFVIKRMKKITRGTRP